LIGDNGIVLGIETSCDETAAALVRADGGVLAAPVLSQLELHAPYGGVVPEIAARAHVEKLDRLVAGAMRETGLGFGDLAGIAATAGPGLIGALIVGLLTGKAIARVHGLRLVAVNHLEAHALTARLTDGVAFPYLLLLVSGGHCQLVAVEGVGRYRQLGTTQDDALGEAYDKVAKMLGLGYPGGPAVEAAARAGDPRRFAFPRPLRGQPGVRLLVLRAEDRGAAADPGPRRGRGRARDDGRPMRRLPGRGGRRAGRPDRAGAGALRRRVSRRRHAGRGGWRGGRTSPCASGWAGSRGAGGSGWWRRRCTCAATTR
jgi:N6-L-threonylcarbamoyladenine synthase